MIRVLYFILFPILGVLAGYNQPKTPILLIPGVGGSKQYNSYGEKIWVVYGRAMYGANCLANPNCRVTTQWKNYGVSEVDVLDPELILGSDYTNYFKPLVVHLQSLGYVPGVDIFAFPYVWRDAMNDETIMDDLDWFIRGLSPIIITHSMGGLVVEKYLQKYPDASIKKVINLSVPFHGAGGYSLKSFIHGYNLGNSLISENATLLIAIAKRFSSTYWLLAKKRLNTREMPRLMINDEDYLDYLNLRVDGFNKSNLAVAKNMYDNLRKPYVKNIYFMYKMRYPGTPWSYNTVTESFTDYVEGDGTVPFLSQKPGYANPNHTKVFMGDHDHVGMLGDSNIHSAIVTELQPCDMAGIYGLGNGYTYTLLHTLERSKYALLDNSKNPSDKEWLWYYSCYAIEIDGIKYDRKLGHACAEYKVYSEAYIQGYYYQKKCHYGNVISLVYRVCYKNETYYNPLLDRCYNKTTGETERQGYSDTQSFQSRKDWFSALNVSLDPPRRIVYVNSTSYNNSALPGDTVYIDIVAYNQKIKEIEALYMELYYGSRSALIWKISGVIGWIFVAIGIVTIVILSVKLYRLKWIKEIQYNQVIDSEL